MKIQKLFSIIFLMIMTINDTSLKSEELEEMGLKDEFKEIKKTVKN